MPGTVAPTQHESDGWNDEVEEEGNGWDDELVIPESPVAKTEPAHKPKPKPKPVAVKKSKESGWDDEDDWGENW